MRSWLALVLLSLPACGTSYTLTEEEGNDITREVFRSHNIFTSSTRRLGPVTVDEVEIIFTVDGWSLADQLGFEYVSDGDPDFAGAATDLGANAEWPKLQAAVDEVLLLESPPGTHILILRTWGHETAQLAEDQLRVYVDQWITMLGR